MTATIQKALDPPAAERRAVPRVPARLAVFVLRWHDPSRSTLVASTHDVGLRGMFIEMKHPPPVGTGLEIEAFHPGRDEDPVRAGAVVRWRRRWRRPRGVGVEIVRLPDEARERLERWLGDAGPGAA